MVSYRSGDGVYVLIPVVLVDDGIVASCVLGSCTGFVRGVRRAVGGRLAFGCECLTVSCRAAGCVLILGWSREVSHCDGFVQRVA